MVLSNGPFTVKLVDNDNKDIPLQKGVFYLTHKQEYAVSVRNTDDELRADASIYIDGKEIGCFRLETNHTIRIERPSDDDKARKLTFLKIDSIEGKSAKVDKSPSPGELKVIIKQEKLSNINRSVCTIDGARSLGFSALGMESDCAFDGPMSGSLNSSLQLDSYNEFARLATGGTGLGTASNQQFNIASKIQTSQEYTLIGRMQLKKEFEEL